jgi:chemotaxis signal transduction protein
MTTYSSHELLRRRADALAKPVADIADEVPVPVLLVRMENGATYGVAAGCVEQVFDDLHLCRLPGGSGELIAVTVVGGAAVPVADLASVLGLAPPRHDRAFLVLLGGVSPLGLLVDHVVGMVALRQSELRKLPAVPGDPAVNIHQGVMPGDIPLLDVQTLLEDSRVVVPRRSHAPGAVPALSHSGAT